jgi:L-ascorbate metabolism protein UlaG (beta-lactamase superfamily)
VLGIAHNHRSLFTIALSFQPFMMIAAIIILLLVAGVWLFLRQPQFGRAPSGVRLEKMKRSPHYQNGQFQNLHPTPSLTGDASYYSVFKKFFFGKSKRSKPSRMIPSKKTDLLRLDPDQDVLVWFGHSSYFLQVDGKKILVDPVFSGHASPVKFTTRSFSGSDVYTADEIPFIDYLFITHDHWDHLDHETLVKLKPKIGKLITGLGVGAHLERWGYDRQIISEHDWNEEVVLDEGFLVHTASARHFSGRGFKRNGTLWMSFVLLTPAMRIYIGGDSGYDDHFASIGNQYGPFDLAILEDGQYNEYWKYIHMMPEEVVQASLDLKAKAVLPVHSSKFSLSLHDWDEPLIRIARESKRRGVSLIHPMIGEAVHLKGSREYKEWWKELD